MADESADDTFFGMVAYVGHHTEWNALDKDWNAALAKRGISAFHMMHFAGGRADYKGWDENRDRRPLMEDLLAAITRRSIRAYGACLNKHEFQRHSGTRDLGFDAPFFVCWQEIAWALSLEANGAGVHPIQFFYSQQDEFKGTIQRFWDLLRKHAPFGRRLARRVHFPDMRTVSGLQVADLLAYEFRHMFHLRKTQPHREMRVPMKALFAHQDAQPFYSLKFLPAWYLELQKGGLAQAGMKTIVADLDMWRDMYADFTPWTTDAVRALRYKKTLDRYVTPTQPQHRTHIDYDTSLQDALVTARSRLLSRQRRRRAMREHGASEHR